MLESVPELKIGCSVPSVYLINWYSAYFKQIIGLAKASFSPSQLRNMLNDIILRAQWKMPEMDILQSYHL